MSVILTACNPNRRPGSRSGSRSAKAKPKSAKTRKQNGSAGKSTVAACNVMMWNFNMGSGPFIILFRKDTMETWVNDDKIVFKEKNDCGDCDPAYDQNVVCFCDNGSTFDFLFFVGDFKDPMKARIKGTRSNDLKEGMVYALTINGYAIPEDSM